MNVLMPKLGLTMETGILVEWFIHDGDVVSVGDLLAVVATDKIDHEIDSPAAGTISIVQEASVSKEIAVGSVIATIDRSNLPD